MIKYIALFLLILPTTLKAETTMYICNYTTFSTKEGLRNVEGNFTLSFIIDKTSGKTYTAGNSGSSEVILIKGADHLAFIEITGGGNVMTTAINSKLESVHSRNTIMFGMLSPQQYYGMCFIKNE